MQLASIKDIQTNRTLRNERYTKLEQLFNGEHAEVFGADENKKGKYIVLNLLRKISKVPANGLAKYPPRYILKDNQVFIEELVFNSSLDIQLYESILANSAMGDAFFAWDIEGVEDFVENTIIKREFEYTLNYIDPRQVEITTNKFNKNKIEKIIVDGKFKEVNSDGKEEELYKRITHTKMNITYEIFKVVNGIQDKIENRISHKVVQHNLNCFFIYHIPNFRKSGQVYGDSDYIDAIFLQAEINNRLTQIVMVYDKHGQPKMIMDSDTFNNIFAGEDVDEDEKGNKFINVGDLEVICLDNKDSKLEMLTWDAKTGESLELLKFLVNQLLANSETAPELLGSSQTGGNMAESGKAMRLRILSTDDKIERLKRYYDKFLKEALYAIQKWELTYATNPKIKEIEKVDINWRAYIPADEKEQVENVVALKGSGLVDDDTLRTQHLGYTSEKNEQIAKKIAEQEEQARFMDKQMASQLAFSDEDESGDE